MVALFLVAILLWTSYLPPSGPATSYPSPPPPSNDVELLTNSSLSRGLSLLRPRCYRNLSMVNITGFSTLPERIQDFLYYQHCRHFPLLLDLPHKCGGEVFLLLVIKSSPGNYERRQVLRETWAEERLHMGTWIRRVFISGTTGAGFEKERMNQLMEVEHRKHGDILQWDFQESFINLTLKQVLFLEWQQGRCPHVRFLLNGDDDVFAHTDNMVHYLQSTHGKLGGDKHLFVGTIMEGSEPIRNPSKYFVPVQVYESTTYPPYCSGGGYLLSGYTSKVLHQMSKYVPLQPIDDAYMGMCLARAGLKPSNHIGVKSGGLRIPSLKVDHYDPCYYKDILMSHRFLPHELYLLWSQVKDPRLRCWSKSTEP
ncbi:hypothetical protein NHX12_021045 [Muraenolepis orangiensis]|uniref:Hexosyltransferase n=1 Tax=Muraenolepis orangiensis TaxID=630683 RepID=A0A9Q0EPR2_9TELE|nr:hypothetical protein NHX12_021045 [Muraenolepis orangiensis]